MRLIRFTCIVLCVLVALGCGTVGGRRRGAAERSATSTYSGRLEDSPRQVGESTALLQVGNVTIPAPLPGPEPEPHWSELLEPLREFSDEEWDRIRRVQPIVRRAAKKWGLSPSLLNGVIWVESKFVRRVRGSRGPRGLMQLMPVTARSVAAKLKRPYRPYNADFNIHVGTYYLNRMLERFDGDLHLALAAYNKGPRHILDWVDEGAESPKPRMPYVSRVYRAAHAFCARLANADAEPRFGVYVCPQLADGEAELEALVLTAEQQILKARVAMSEQEL